MLYPLSYGGKARILAYYGASNTLPRRCHAHSTLAPYCYRFEFREFFQRSGFGMVVPLFPILLATVLVVGRWR